MLAFRPKTVILFADLSEEAAFPAFIAQAAAGSEAAFPAVAAAAAKALHSHSVLWRDPGLGERGRRLHCLHREPLAASEAAFIAFTVAARKVLRSPSLCS